MKESKINVVACMKKWNEQYYHFLYIVSVCICAWLH